MTTIVDGHHIAEQVYERIRTDLLHVASVPTLGVILVGTHAPSLLYVEKKRAAAERIGMKVIVWDFADDISEDSLCDAMQEIQEKEALNGLIVQLPLPQHIDTTRIVNQIHPSLDVDFLSDAALGTLVSGSYQGEPPTPGAILEILRHHAVAVEGATVALIGGGRLVGKPLANMLMSAGATISVITRATKDPAYYTSVAEIVVSATGMRGVLTPDMVRDGVVVIDAGISVENGVTSGDIDADAFTAKASLITPTPGGVGPITVAKLLENTARRAMT